MHQPKVLLKMSYRHGLWLRRVFGSGLRRCGRAIHAICIGSPTGQRLAPPYLEPSKVEARVALACVWMQFLKLWKTAHVAGGMRARCEGKRPAWRPRMLSMYQRKVNDCPSLLGFSTLSCGRELQDRRRGPAVLRRD